MGDRSGPLGAEAGGWQEGAVSRGHPQDRASTLEGGQTGTWPLECPRLMAQGTPRGRAPSKAQPCGLRVKVRPRGPTAGVMTHQSVPGWKFPWLRLPSPAGAAHIPHGGVGGSGGPGRRAQQSVKHVEKDRGLQATRKQVSPRASSAHSPPLLQRDCALHPELHNQPLRPPGATRPWRLTRSITVSPPAAIFLLHLNERPAPGVWAARGGSVDGTGRGGEGRERGLVSLLPCRHLCFCHHPAGWVRGCFRLFST